MQDLVALARSQDIELLEQAWATHVTDPQDPPAYCETLEALSEGDFSGKTLELGTQMVEALASSGKVGDAIDVAHAIVAGGAHNEPLARRLWELLKEHHGEETWFPMISAKAKLSDESISRDGLESFLEFRGFTTGYVIYHAAGWAEGVVELFDVEKDEAKVRFAKSGRTQDFPIQTLFDSFRVLPKSDLRSMRMIALEEMEQLVAERPSVLIRKAAKMYRGEINSTQLKAELCPAVIPTKKWPTWWKKAKTAAASDPWLQVEGSKTRPVFVLRKKPLSLGDEMKMQFRHADNLGEANGLVREQLSRTQEVSARDMLLDLAAEQVEASLVPESKAHPAHVLDGILLLEEHGRTASVSASEELRTLLLDEESALQPAKLDELATQASKEHAVSLLREALGENWKEQCTAKITEFPDTVLEKVVDLYVETGHGPELLEIWHLAAPYPRRHPILTYLLGRLYADGVFEGAEREPDPVTVVRVLLHLLRVLVDPHSRIPNNTRLTTRVVSLLTGRRAVLPSALDGISRDDLANYLGITERAGHDFPTEVVDAILRTVSDCFPDLTAKPDKPFWELDFIYVTSAGLKRQREIYRVLVDEKIPANSTAIGAAASLGDLSENSEWDAAMEEQRNLTSRATEMDVQLRKARLIDDQEIPDNIVAPGTRVKFTRLEDGDVQEFDLLGPFDIQDQDDALNYRAPMAQKLLGKKVGDEAELPIPDGTETVRIDAITKLS